MDNNIFRKDSLDRISSADELHDYMRVTSPRLWMFLSVILVLIIGFILFASLVSIENDVDTKAEVHRYDSKDTPSMDIEIQIPPEIGEIVHVGMDVRIDKHEGTITATYENDVLGKGGLVELNDPEVLLNEGSYKAKIVLEKVSPIQFLFH